MEKLDFFGSQNTKIRKNTEILSVRLKKDEKKEIKMIAEREGYKMSAYIRKLIRDKIKNTI